MPVVGFLDNVNGQFFTALLPWSYSILSLQGMSYPFPFRKCCTFGNSSAPCFLSLRPAPANFSASQQHSSVTQCISTMDEGDVEAPPQCFPSASSKKHANFSQSSCPKSPHKQIIINEIMKQKLNRAHAQNCLLVLMMSDICVVEKAIQLTSLINAW